MLIVKKPIALSALTLAYIIVQADEKLLAPKSGFFGGEHSLSHLNAAKLFLPCSGQLRCNIPMCALRIGQA